MPRKRTGDQDLICRRCLVACTYDRHYYTAATKTRHPNSHAPEPIPRSDWDAELNATSLAAAQAVRHLKDKRTP